MDTRILRDWPNSAQSNRGVASSDGPKRTDVLSRPKERQRLRRRGALGCSNSPSIEINQWFVPNRMCGHASPHPASLVPLSETGRRNRDWLSGYGEKFCWSEIPVQVERPPCIGLASAWFRDHESAMFTGRPRYSDQFGSIEGTGFRLCRRVEISRVCKGGSPIGHRQFGFGSEKQATSRT